MNSAISTSPKHLETALLLNCSPVCAWAGYRLGSSWKRVFLSKLQNVCFAVTAQSEGGKNIFIILGIYFLPRRKWGNTETDKWEMKTIFALPNFKLHFLWLWERLMLPKLIWALGLYHTFNTEISPGWRSYTILLLLMDFVFPAYAPKPLTPIHSTLAAW